MAIVQIRGTSGSGKTFLMRQIMEELHAEPILNDEGKIEAYRMDRDFFAIGSYKNQCGGADALGISGRRVKLLRAMETPEDEKAALEDLSQIMAEEEAAKLVEKAGRKKPLGAWGSVAITEHLVRKYATQGHVIFEGLMLSGIWGRWYQVAKDFGGYVWLFMDTPLETCHARILERNGGRPINMGNLESKYNASKNVYEKAVAAKEIAVWLDHKRPLEHFWEVVNPILEGKSQEPQSIPEEEGIPVAQAKSQSESTQAFRELSLF